MLITACSTGEVATTTTATAITTPYNNSEEIKDKGETIANTDIYLSWVAPAEREDNAPIALSEIAGYRVYFGTAQGQYPNGITIDDGSAEGHTFQDFTTGTYYFVITTIDTEGRESEFSAEVIKSI